MSDKKSKEAPIFLMNRSEDPRYPTISGGFSILSGYLQIGLLSYAQRGPQIKNLPCFDPRSQVILIDLVCAKLVTQR